MAQLHLSEVDKVEISVIINDEIDQISPSPNANVHHTQSFAGIPLSDVNNPQSRGGAKLEMPMENICCGAHGLSLLIKTVTKGAQKSSLLFDAGPEEAFFEANTRRLRLDMSNTDLVSLSHWHRDHSGGLLAAIKLIREGKSSSEKVRVDIHPDRPPYRGIMAHEPISLQPDPTFAEIEEAGGEIEAYDQPRTVLHDTFLISGEIPRVTEYEGGIPGGIRLDSNTGKWVSDELIMDERFVMCKIKDKGLVIFTGCSHAGLINIAKHAVQLDDSPIHAIVGGYHLADASQEKMGKTMADLKLMAPHLLMPGHCTGWRFKGLVEQEMPGQMAPIFGGTKYELS